MTLISFEIPEPLLGALGNTSAEAIATIRMAAAAKLWELDRLSSGAAASLGGVPRVVFLSRVAEFGVATFRSTGEDLEEDASNA